MAREKGLTVVGTEEHREEQKHSDVLELSEERLELLLRAHSSLNLDDGTVTSNDLVCGRQPGSRRRQRAGLTRWE
jgi:hypothetical protein